MKAKSPALRTLCGCYRICGMLACAAGMAVAFMFLQSGNALFAGCCVVGSVFGYLSCFAFGVLIELAISNQEDLNDVRLYLESMSRVNSESDQTPPN